MSLDELVNVSISASAATPSKEGFGTILIAAQKVPPGMTSRTRKFGSLKEMTDFGFSVSDPAYLCAQKIKAQDPSVSSWKVGKRANKLTQALKLKCKSATQGDVYSVKIAGVDVTYTVGAAETTTTVATAIELLVDAVTGVTSTSATDTISFGPQAGAGELIDVANVSDNFEFWDATTDPGSTTGLAADLAAIQAADGDWYGLALDSNSQAEIEVAALFVEANKKFFVWNNSDTKCGDSAVTTDVFSTTKAAAYARSGGLFSKAQLLSYSGAAWTAEEFVTNPGSQTMHLKTLKSVTVDTLTEAEQSAIKDKNGSFYVVVANINVTEGGMTSAGEWFDTTRFVDWQRAEIKYRVFTLLLNNKKIPYTDLGFDAIGAVVDGALDAGVEAGGLEKGTTSVTVPKVANIDAGTRATRHAPGFKFGGRLSGAVHSLDLDGTLTV